MQAGTVRLRSIALGLMVMILIAAPLAAQPPGAGPPGSGAPPRSGVGPRPPGGPGAGADPFIRPSRPRKMRDYSWIHIDPPEPREIKVHDIITIIVDEKSEVTLNSQFNRQRMAKLKAELKDFMRIGEDGNLENAAENQPTIDANLQGRLRATGQALNQEGIRYRIAATVVDVLPNGNLVLEARKSIRTNGDLWSYSLTGVISSDKINPDATALSENVANLKIVKKQDGRVHDSTKRPWGILLYDLFSPF